MDNRRNILMLLIVIFVVVLVYNGLYFTGVIGNYGGETPLEELPTDPRFDIPGLRSDGQATPQPRPSARAVDNSNVEPARPTVMLADLSIGSNWGRNPFLTPQEIWALENYRPVYQVQPTIPPGGLYVSAVVVDSSGRRAAIINGDVFGVGDVVAGMEVVDVWDDGVVFQLDGQRHVIRIGDPEIQLSVNDRATGRQ